MLLIKSFVSLLQTKAVTLQISLLFPLSFFFFQAFNKVILDLGPLSSLLYTRFAPSRFFFLVTRSYEDIDFYAADGLFFFRFVKIRKKRTKPSNKCIGYSLWPKTFAGSNHTSDFSSVCRYAIHIEPLVLFLNICYRKIFPVYHYNIILLI